MASLFQVLSAIEQQVASVTSGLMSATGGVLTVNTGIDWPPVKVLQANVLNGSCVVAIFDRKMARDVTRWAPITIGTTLTNATLTTQLSNAILPALSTATVTLGGSVTPGDAVSLVLHNPMALLSLTGAYNPDAATVVSGGPIDTPTSMATKLATAVAASTTLSPWMSASATGPVVTLTSLIDGPMTLRSYTGNGGTNTVEIGRRERELQVVLWTSTIEDRNVVGDQIEALIAQLEVFYGAYQAGIPLPDGTFGCVRLRNDYFLDDATLADTFRRDFLISCEYPVTTTDQLYAMLAPVYAYKIDL